MIVSELYRVGSKQHDWIRHSVYTWAGACIHDNSTAIICLMLMHYSAVTRTNRHSSGIGSGSSSNLSRRKKLPRIGSRYSQRDSKLTVRDSPVSSGVCGDTSVPLLANYYGDVDGLMDR